MGKKRVIIGRTNLPDRDPRLTKEIDALKSAGYAVILLCWDRDRKAPRSEQQEIAEIRLRLKAPWGGKILCFLPIWWCFVFYHLMVSSWDIAHGINFDSIVPMILAGKMKRRPVIYEMYDVYEDSILLPKLLRRVFLTIDKVFMRLAASIVIVDKARIRQLNGIPNKNISVVYNSPPDFFEGSTSPSHKKQTGGEFTVFYAAALFRVRRLNLDKVIAAIKGIDDVRLIIAGFGDQVEDIKRWVSNAAGKTQFIGGISYDEAMRLTATSDLAVALYDPIRIQNRFASPNKLFEAMMYGKPILVSSGTAMADIVEKENCGLTVDCNSVDEIRKAIARLKEDPELCRQLGANGRRAYEERYNWGIMKQCLLTLYQEIGNVKS
jgi:glycosyltransferase involved in cell wall biosynthesis